MEKFFTEMFAFEAWANEQILNWLVTNPHQPEMIKIFAHLIAENLPWICLLRGEYVPDDITSEPNWTLDECRRKLPMVMDALQAFVANLDESSLAKIIVSPGPNGVMFENSVTEILTNLLNHSEHHRGQLVGMIHQKSGEYVPSLYMNYLRSKRLVAA